MRQIFFVLIISFSEMLFSQTLDFLKNESLKEKLNSIETFIEKSNTLQTNYRSWNKYNIYIISEPYVHPSYFFEFRLETSINKDFKTSKCIKLNDYIIWVLNDYCPVSGYCNVDESLFDIDSLNKIQDCGVFITNRRKDKEITPMVQSTFLYQRTKEYEDYLLKGLTTPDSFLFLSIEYELFNSEY